MKPGMYDTSPIAQAPEEKDVDTAEKKELLFLVGCEPQLAYRIRIEAESLATQYNVTVRGIRFFKESPSEEERGEYTEYRTTPPPFLKGLLATLRHYYITAYEQHQYGHLIKTSLWLGVAAILMLPLLPFAMLFYALKTIPMLCLWIITLFRKTRGYITGAVDGMKRFVIRAIQKVVFVTIRGIRFVERWSIRLTNKGFNFLLRIINFFYRLELRISNSLQSRYRKRVHHIKNWLHNTNPIRLKNLLRIIGVRSMAHFNDWYDGKPSPDVLYVKDLETLPAAVAIQRFTGSKIIYGCYEFFPYSIPHFPRWGTAMLRFIERKLVKHVEHVVTVTPPMANAISQTYPFLKGRIHSIPNVDPTLSIPAVPADEELQERIAGRRSFLYQGSFANERGIEELLQAWKHIDPKRGVLIIRGGQNAFRSKYIAMAKSMDTYGKGVIFVPPLEDKKEPITQSILAAMEADICLIPYLPVTLNNKHACPRKLSHYMHAGRMIVSSNLTYVKEVIEEAECGLTYDPSNLQSLVDVINICIDDEVMVKRYQQNALAYAQQHYNWNHYEPLFLECMKA
ncbi:MAG: glycosyltransferase [Rickettsiales bacterium]